MILKNFRDMLYAVRTAQFNSNLGTDRSWAVTGLSMKDMSGVTCTGLATRSDIQVDSPSYYGRETAGNFLAALGNINVQSEWRWNHYVGSGTTAPALDDYALESPISGLSDVKTAVSYNQGQSGEIITTFTCTGTNSGSDTVTISEIGIIKGAVVYHNDSWSHDNILVIRQILDEPISVAPNTGYRVVIEMVEGVTDNT